MNAYQDYQSLVKKYQEGTQLIKKLGMSSIAIQAGIFGFMNGWEHLQIGYYNLAAPIFISLAIFLMIKDFLPFRRIDGNMTRMILEGLELEKRDSGSGYFFHNVLKNFNIAWILLQRAVIDLGVLWCFGNLAYQYILNLNLAFVISHTVFNLCIGIIGTLLCMLYYAPFKALVKAKTKIFAQ